LYLRVFRNADGALVGAFRNPEVNSQGGAQQFRVALNGNAVQFAAQRNPQSTPIHLDATLDPRANSLTLKWPALDRTVTLQRVDGAAAANFFPRAPAAGPYTYHAPAQTGDGWTTAAATDVGFDETALARVVQDIAQSDPSSVRPRLIHSLLVARHGKLVLEEYFFGYDRDQPHDTRSAGKTFGSVMMGAAMLRGTPIGPQTRVYDELRAMGPFTNPDPRKAEITVAQLMTHTSGLVCDDNDDNSPGNEDTMQSQRAQPNWWKYTLDLPMAHDPGKRYAYCSGGMNLVGAVLTTGTHEWLPQFFDDTIARPLQFGPYYWNLMPTNEGYLGGGAYLRPRDLLKIGQLYLNGGIWNGRRVVSNAWIHDSTAPHEAVDERTTGIDAADFTDYYVPGFSDGYAWHISTIQSGRNTYREYQASGNGGQLLFVIPELDLTVAITAGNYGQGGIWSRFRDEIVGDGIIPALSHVTDSALPKGAVVDEHV
jgi:CubicO group peptidase (beta-lactamase class C family)